MLSIYRRITGKAMEKNLRLLYQVDKSSTMLIVSDIFGSCPHPTTVFATRQLMEQNNCTNRSYLSDKILLDTVRRINTRLKIQTELVFASTNLLKFLKNQYFLLYEECHQPTKLQNFLRKEKYNINPSPLLLYRC